MKALQVFFMLLPFSLMAQTDSSYGHSRLQKFLMEPGRSIHVTTDTIEVLNSVEVGVITARDWLTGEQRHALSFLPGSLFNSTLFSIYSTQLDIDELDPLIRILDTVNKLNFANKRLEIQEFRYVSSGLTEIVASNRNTNPKRWDIAIYRRYRQFQQAVPGTAIVVRESDIEPLLQLLVRFKNSLWYGQLKGH